MVQRKIRWGILGTGNIAHAFVLGLKDVSNADITAVGSRSAEKARKFANLYQIQHSYASYQELVESPHVDVIYIASPHSEHAAHCMLCLTHGKAVLCEKPFTLNADQARAVFDFARAQGLFIMEAMWTRFQPGLQKLKQLLQDGIIGKPQLLQADFGFRARYDPQSRLFAPELGGGALLDIGIYPISLAHFLFGNPVQVTGLAQLAPTGVDETCGAVMQFAQGELAILHASLRANSPTQAMILGSAGRLQLHSPIYRPPGLTLWRTADPDSPNRSQQTYEFFKQFGALRKMYHKLQTTPLLGMVRNHGQYIATPFESNGYQYQATEVNRCLLNGLIESPQMPAQATIEIQMIMDKLRQQWGMVYPQEQLDAATQ